ncbi:MAG TPA: hypothetical protein VI522_01630, partial [Gammaproteobacteria bacterium]|nr:hypothetical protein [Gammaproteobacteria bacterium]
MVKHIWHSLAVLTWVLSAGLSLAAAHPKTVCDKMDCDLIVSPPEVVDGDCGGNTIHLEYSIFNDSPQLQTFTFSLDEITPSTLATVEITDSTCGPNFTTTGGSGLVGPGQTCILTISVIPTSDITCTPGCIDWELTIIHANQTIVEPIDPCFSPPPPPGACVGATPTNPLGDSSKFIVLGGSKVKNDNNPIYTTLCGGDVGVSPGTTITNLTDVDNYVGACSGT